ncbi:MAG: tetratricopeptide repeat protein [bacterium]
MNILLREKPFILIAILLIVMNIMTLRTYICKACVRVTGISNPDEYAIQKVIKGSIQEGLEALIEKPEEESPVQKYLDKAEELIAEDDIEAAFEQYNIAYKIEPFHPGLNAIFAFISATQDYEMKAKEYIDIALSNLFYIDDDRRLSFYWYILALAYERLYQKKEAKITLDLAFRNLTTSSEKYGSILSEGLELYEELGYPLGCYNIMKEQAQKSPEIFEECAAAAFQYSETKREQIAETYLTLPDDYKTDLEKRRILATWYMDVHQEKKALTLLYENLLSTETPDPEDIKQYNNYWYLAVIDQYEQEFDDKDMVEKQLYLLASKHPEIVDFRLQLASLFHETGENEKACMEYKKILYMDPNNFDVLHQLGKLEYKVGHCTEAIKYLSQYECSSKECLELVYYLAKAYECNYDIDNALASWEKLKALNYPSISEYEINSDSNTPLIEKVKEFLMSLRTQIESEREKTYFAEANDRISRLRAYSKKSYRRIPLNLKDAMHGILDILSTYNKANKMRINGMKETICNYEAFHNNPLFGAYNASTDIYLAELIYHDCLSKAFLISNIHQIKKARYLIIEATNMAAEGISLFAEGYYIKEINYEKQFEKGEGLIKEADKKIVKACKLLLPLVRQYFLDFTFDIEREINSYIDYYSHFD